MRIQQVQNTQRVYDDIRVTKVETLESGQELLTADLLDENEEVYLFEIITSNPCQIIFTFQTGKVSHPKLIEPNRVVTFDNLRPIKSAQFIGDVGTILEIAIAI